MLVFASPSFHIVHVKSTTVLPSECLEIASLVSNTDRITAGRILVAYLVFTKGKCSTDEALRGNRLKAFWRI